MQKFSATSNFLKTLSILSYPEKNNRRQVEFYNELSAPSMEGFAPLEIGKNFCVKFCRLFVRKRRLEARTTSIFAKIIDCRIFELEKQARSIVKWTRQKDRDQAVTDRRLLQFALQNFPLFCASTSLYTWIHCNNSVIKAAAAFSTAIKAVPGKSVFPHPTRSPLSHEQRFFMQTLIRN